MTATNTPPIPDKPADSRIPVKTSDELDKAIVIGFLYGIQSDFLPADEVVRRVAGFRHTKGYREARALFLADRQRLIQRIEAEAVGEDVDLPMKQFEHAYHDGQVSNATRRGIRQRLSIIKQEEVGGETS